MANNRNNNQPKEKPETQKSFWRWITEAVATEVIKNPQPVIDVIKSVDIPEHLRSMGNSITKNQKEQKGLGSQDSLQKAQAVEQKLKRDLKRLRRES